MPGTDSRYFVQGGTSHGYRVGTGCQSTSQDTIGLEHTFSSSTTGFDVADNEIVARAAIGDLVITGDIPLAAEVMEKGAEALTPRGEKYSEDTIRQRLNMRDFMDTLRSSGIQTGGQPPLGASDKQKFANHLDQYITRKTRENTNK